jgi:Asp-tRNA(Asn)/Glu-tRNA(Gln) amidotransferase A subunit family amidase
MTELCDLGAVELRHMIGAKELSPVELLEACIARTEAVDPAVNAMVARDFERARKTAQDTERAVMAGAELGALHGLPVGIKDLNATEGLRTTQGSLLYKDHVPEADERMVAAVRAAGGIVFGKTNTPEFGAGANTKNRVFGATGNPFDRTRTCGGSSGGSAVALAAAMVPLATGSDLGGSLRTPAGFCGVVGIRPTPGTVPNETRAVGLTPLSVQGPMGRSVADAALLLSAQAGHDRRDPYSRAVDPALLRGPSQVDLSSLKVGVTEDLGVAAVDDGIRKVFRARIEQIAPLFGACETRDPDLGPAHEIFEILRGVLFVAAHKARLEQHRDLLGPNVIDNTERGLLYGLADVAWAHVEQAKTYRRFVALMDELDVLLAPACSVSPFPHAQLYVEEINGKKMDTYMRWLAITYGVTLTTHPVVVLPCGRDELGLPFGIQVIGRMQDDARLIDIAHSLETVLAEDSELARPLPDLEKLKSEEAARP